MANRLLPWLQLLRPANIVTAFADILAGSAVAGSLFLISEEARSALWPLIIPQLPNGTGWLLLATAGLYGGGVVLNDVFDAKIDAMERPERPIPAGLVSRWSAALFGIFLLIAGISFASVVNTTASLLAFLISACVVIYDGVAKNSSVLGPLFMGLCRGGNLLLGVALFPLMIAQYWYLACIPLIYIMAITLISQREVHGGSRLRGFTALMMVVLISAGLIMLSPLEDYSLVSSLPFTLLFSLLVLPVFFLAAKNPSPERIRIAVKRGILSLIILNSALAAGFGGVVFGLLVLLLLPISWLLSRAFSVT